MTEYTIVMPYYNNPKTLAFHAGVWWSYPEDVKNHVRVIVVDDYSDEGKDAAGVLAKAPVGLDVQVYRVKDDIEWNDVGARNLGMRHCETGWALLTDIDHVLHRDSAKRIACSDLDSGAFYTLDRQWADRSEEDPHCNSFLVTCDKFWEAGGYDEDYAGVWGGDTEYVNILKQHARHMHLAGAPLSLWQSALPDGRTPRTDEQLDGWRRQRREIKSKKQRGDLPRLPENPIRFEWERVV